MQGSDTVRRTLTVRRVDSARTAPRVRHVDQLSDAALERFVNALESAPRAVTDRENGIEREIVADGGGDGVDAFVDGEVVVFTDYYRIELD